MSEHRPLVLTLTVYATALGALGVAAFTGWQRCGRGSECSSELALGIVAVAPACLIGILVLFTMRAMLVTPWVRSVLLAAGIGVAALPLAAFLLQDLWQIPVFSLLVAAAALLALVREREAEEYPPPPDEPHPSPPAKEPPVATVDVDGGVEGQPEVAPSFAESVFDLVDGVAALNQEIVLLGERLAERR